MSHALLCHTTTTPFCEPFHGGPTPSIAQSFLIGPSHGQAREALVAIDRHVGDHRVANGYRCRDLDYVLTLPEVRQRTSHQASPPPGAGMLGFGVRCGARYDLPSAKHVGLCYQHVGGVR